MATVNYELAAEAQEAISALVLVKSTAKHLSWPAPMAKQASVLAAPEAPMTAQQQPSMVADDIVSWIAVLPARCAPPANLEPTTAVKQAKLGCQLHQMRQYGKQLESHQPSRPCLIQ